MLSFFAYPPLQHLEECVLHMQWAEQIPGHVHRVERELDLEIDLHLNPSFDYPWPYALGHVIEPAEASGLQR